MIANDQPLRAKMIKDMIQNCLLYEDERNLTKWERDFIASIDEQFEAKGDLSVKQCEILERIYDR